MSLPLTQAISKVHAYVYLLQRRDKRLKRSSKTESTRKGNDVFPLIVDPHGEGKQNEKEMIPS